jgi:ribose 5-phosphate isomerase B
MKIAIASDHRGVQVKSRVNDLLTRMGYEVVDYGPEDANDSVDYPDYAAKVAREVSKGTMDRGILICGTGIGLGKTPNKFKAVVAPESNTNLTPE